MSESVREGLSRPRKETGAPAAFRKHLPGLYGASVALCLSAYLLFPLFQDENPVATKGSVEESYNLDGFLVRDASGSVDPEHYGRIEQEILDHLSARDGDRISYSVFGSDTIPEEILPPSADENSIAAQRQNAGQDAHKISGTTDFERLFDRLREAIRKDREQQKATQREPHADAIIILSDGVPDLTPDNQPCPVPNQEFISDQIVDAYDALINSSYATHEAIYVRLILVGAPRLCGPRIKEEWERRLGPIGLEVLSYSEIGSDLRDKLLRPLRRHPRILFRIGKLKDQERRKLDQGERFSVQFSARSFLKGGELRIESAMLIDEKNRELPLHALRNSQISPTEWGHHPVFIIESPASGKLLGPTLDREEFYLQSDSSFVPLESEKYRLEVKAYVLEQPASGRTIPSVEIDPVEVLPCNKAEQKRQVRSRLRIPGTLSLALAGFFGLGALAWYSTGRVPRIQASLEGFFVVPYKRWIWLFLFLLIPVSLGFLALGKVWLFSGLLVLGYLLFQLEGSKRSPSARLIFRLVEFAALPLITEVAAQYLI